MACSCRVHSFHRELESLENVLKWGRGKGRIWFFFLIGKYSYGSPLKVFFLNVAQLRHPTNQITYYSHFTYKIFKNLKAIFFNTLAVFSSENWIFCVARQDFHQKCRCVCSYKIMETAYRQESLVMVMLQLHNTVFVFQKLLDSVQNLARATPSV